MLMATERLIVKNFGPIREADLDLRKVTVLIGEQASGKSVLAKLVAIFTDILLEENTLSLSWDHYNLENFVKEDSKINYYNPLFSNFLSAKLVKTFEDNSLETFFQGYLKSLDQWRKDRLQSQANPNISKEERQRNRSIRDELRSQRQHLRSLTRATKYFPAERNLISVLSKVIFQLVDNDIKLPKFLTTFLSDYETARENLPQFVLDFLEISFAYRDGKDKVILKENKEIELAESASGFQTAIPMAIVVESLQEKSKNWFIIEEPELNLYPTTQKKLVEYLIEKCTQGDNRLIITTHSPYILTALNNCIQAKNVVDLYPDTAAEVNKLVPAQYQIGYQDVMAYYVGGGTAKPIMNEEFQMIDANALDDVSNELGRVFDSLLDLKYQHQE